MRTENKPAVRDGARGQETSFAELLVQLAEAALQGGEFVALAAHFCRAVAEGLGFSAVSCWDLTSPEELMGIAAAGEGADVVPGARLVRPREGPIAEVLNTRKPVCGSEILSGIPGLSSGRSVIVAPLLTSGAAAGVLVCAAAEAEVPSRDLPPRIAAIAAILSSALEARRLSAISGEERRRAELLVRCTRLLHSRLEVGPTINALAEGIRELLYARIVTVLLRRGDNFALEAVTADEPALVEAVRRRHAQGGCPMAEELALRAAQGDQPLIVPIDPDDPELPEYLSTGEIVAAPIRTAHTSGALLVYCGPGRTLGHEETIFLGAIAGLGAMAISNAELYATVNVRARELQQLLEISSELNSSLRLPQFVQSFTERAAALLGARSAALALVQRSLLETVVLHGPAGAHDKALMRRLNLALTDAAAQHPAAITSGGAADLLGANVAEGFGWQDLVLARLTEGDGELIGVLCLMDRGRQELSSAERNLLQALAAHASIALENSRLFTRMDQANRHWIEIFDSISDFIVVHDESYKVLRVNRSLAEFIGVRPAELIGVGMRALVAMAADVSSQPCPFCRVGMEAADEYIHPVLERTYLVSTSRVHGAFNDGLQTIHVLKDITDRREAERRYRELFDNIQEGLFFATPEGRFVEVNDAIVRMLGYDSREELLQTDISTQIYLSAEHRQRFSEAIEKTGVLRNYQALLRRKDGSVIHTLQNAFAVRDAQGKILQYRGLMLDITELKNFQAELQRERDFNTKILNNTSSMILVVDTAGLVSYANRRCLEGGAYRQSELLGRRLTDLVAPGRRQALSEALTASLGGQQVDNLELPVLLVEGRVGQFSVNLSPMRDEQGNVNSIVVAMTDITDAALLQAKLMHTEKMAAVGQLVSGVAHEVNNPLTAILGFADLLLEHPEIPHPAKKDLRVIIQEAQRTKQIVQNLLSFARQMPPQRKAMQVNAVLRRTLALRAYDFTNHGVEIVEQLNNDLPEVVGDAHQLQQVFLNILNNAYDAVRETGRTGRIEIETAPRGAFAEIRFRDNGAGIAYPERIFDPFFTTKEVGKGTGLGLSICYGIVREHGGEISCHNNTGAPGATFVVRLPVSQAALAAGAGASL
jgi:two-component system NtrC family sensor kinase